MKSSSLKVIDLFSGCGGLSLGFQNSGFEIVAAFENWKSAINVYQQNFHHPIFEYDLSQVNNPHSAGNLRQKIILVGRCTKELQNQFLSMCEFNGRFNPIYKD